MTIDFIFNNIKYVLNFDISQERYSFDVTNIKAVEIRVYHGLNSSLYSSSVKEIKDEKIIWSRWDDGYMPPDARDYCDKMFKLKNFT